MSKQMFADARLKSTDRLQFAPLYNHERDDHGRILPIRSKRPYNFGQTGPSIAEFIEALAAAEKNPKLRGGALRTVIRAYVLGMWTPQKMLAWFEAYKKTAYIQAGGNPDLWIVPESGSMPGPQLKLAMEDARKCGAYWTAEDKWDGLIRLEIAQRLGYGSPAVGKFIPYLDRGTASGIVLDGILGSNIDEAIHLVSANGWSDWSDAQAAATLLSTYIVGVMNQGTRANLQAYFGGPSGKSPYVLAAQDPYLFILNDGRVVSDMPNVPEPWSLHIGGEWTCIPIDYDTMVRMTKILQTLHPEWTWNPADPDLCRLLVAEINSLSHDVREVVADTARMRLMSPTAEN